jgi:hypothetical protein
MKESGLRAGQFHFWEYFLRIFSILSLKCRQKTYFKWPELLELYIFSYTNNAHLVD